MAGLTCLIGSGSASGRVPGLDLSFRDSGHDDDSPDCPELRHSIASTNPSLEKVQGQGGAGAGRKASCSLLGSTSALTQPPGLKLLGCRACVGVGVLEVGGP